MGGLVDVRVLDPHPDQPVDVEEPAVVALEAAEPPDRRGGSAGGRAPPPASSPAPGATSGSSGKSWPSTLTAGAGRSSTATAPVASTAASGASRASGAPPARRRPPSRCRSTGACAEFGAEAQHVPPPPVGRVGRHVVGHDVDEEPHAVARRARSAAPRSRPRCRGPGRAGSGRRRRSRGCCRGRRQYRRQVQGLDARARRGRRRAGPRRRRTRPRGAAGGRSSPSGRARAGAQSSGRSVWRRSRLDWAPRLTRVGRGPGAGTVPAGPQRAEQLLPAARPVDVGQRVGA